MKHQLDALTSTRGIAALLVVVFHYGCTVFPFSIFEHFFRSGNLAVGYFFVLSGFVMYYTYHNRPGTYGAFMKKRLLRIAPVYYIALALSAVFFLTHGGVATPVFFWQLLLNATFTQALFPGHALTINTPGWSLSVEVFFYALFPLMLAFANKNIRGFIWFAILFFLASQAAHLFLVKMYKPVWATAMHDFTYYSPLFHFNQFLLGMAGGYMFLQYKKRAIRYSSLFPLVAVVLLINFLPGTISLHNGLLAPLFMLLIVGIALNNPVVMRWRPLVFLGEVSYGIYIFQEPVRKYAVKINDRFLHLPEMPLFYAYLLGLIACATLCYYLVEKPVRNMAKRA